ncbi:MAG TPA: glycosyltransferase [Candidatus Anoxymicrobiaceae bacterium]
MDFSIIIPGYNAGKTIKLCLEGIAEQDYRGKVEVLVVESGDSDYVPDLARRFNGVRFIVPPAQIFSGQARNVAARFASGDVLVFLDSDCRPERGWLSGLADGHARGFAAISGAMDNGNTESIVATAEYLVSHSSYSSKMPAHVLDDTTACSANMSVRREAYDAAGGFAATRRANDFIFSRHLHDMNVDILFCPDASVWHFNPCKLDEYLRGQVTRGYWNAMARMELGLEGSIVEKCPPLAFGLFFVRFWRLVARCLRFRIIGARRFFEALPLCAAGVAAWTWGYFKASLEKKNSEWAGDELLPAGWEQYKIIRSDQGDAGSGGGT